MMIEVWVEGVTRFISLWHTADSDYVGPIRSTRPTDPTLLRPLGAALATSGGQPWVQAEFRANGVPMIQEVRPDTFRIPSRRAPHNLYGDTNALRQRDTRNPLEAPLAPLWRFGKTPADAKEATTIVTNWPFNFDTGWEWDGTQYAKFTKGVPHEWLDPDGPEPERASNSSTTTGPDTTTTTTTEETGGATGSTATTEGAGPVQEEVAADTVIIMEMSLYTKSGDSGSSLPTTQTVGEGPAYVFSEGKVQVGIWSRESVDDWFTLTDEDGDEMVVAPGRIWMQLPPPGGVTFE